MKFSGLVFPAPNPATYNSDRLLGEILYVPKDYNECPYKYKSKASLDSNNPVLDDLSNKYKRQFNSDALLSSQSKFFDQ